MRQEKKERLMNPLQVCIDSLPNTPEKIAGFFAERDLKGRQQRSLDCVLARWLRAEGFKDAFVTRYVVGYDYFGGKKSNYHLVAVPPGLKSFLSNFDHSHYPDLIDEQEPEA